MTAFAGIVRFDGTFGDHESAERLALSLGAAGVAGVQTVRRGEAIFARRSKEPLHLDGHERSGLADGGNGFAALACLDNRDELRARLGLSLAGGDRIADGDLVIRIFEREGEAGIARCLGAFCFAYWDRQARRLTLARDCLGRRALFFHRGDGFIAFATTLRALLALPAVPREPDETVLANFLALNLNEARRTFYRGVERVPSRTIVTIDRSGVRHRHYWTPDLTAPPPYSRDQDYVERARELLDQTVAAAIADTPRVAISASGGLDSSAIAATVARLGRAESVTCYTLIPPTGSQLDIGPDRYWDESDKMEALGRMHPSLALRFIAPETAHPFEEDETRYFTRSQVPVLNPSNFGWFSHMRDAALASGHSVILNGTRGNLGLSWRGTLSLAALLSAGEWRRFADDFRAVARESRRSLPRTFASEVLKPVAPAWLRRTLYRIARGDPDSVAHFSALNPAYIAEKRSPRPVAGRRLHRAVVRRHRLGCEAASRPLPLRSQSIRARYGRDARRCAGFRTARTVGRSAASRISSHRTRADVSSRWGAALLRTRRARRPAASRNPQRTAQRSASGPLVHPAELRAVRPWLRKSNDLKHHLLPAACSICRD